MEEPRNSPTDALTQALALIQERQGGIPLQSAEDQYLLGLFLEARNQQVTSAVERFENHLKLRKEFDLSMRPSVEVLDAIKLGVMFKGQVDKSGRPSIFAVPSRLDWTKVTLSQMRKMWYFQVMRTIYSTPTAQTLGVNLIAEAAGASLSIFKRDFQAFIGRAVNECMPMKVHSISFVHEPWIFSIVLWPIVSLFLKQKLRQRVHVLGKHQEKLLEMFDASHLPVQVGGTVEFNGEMEAEQCRAEFGVEG